MSQLDWKAPWLDHTAWILEHLESLGLKPVQALGLLVIEHANRHDIPINHELMHRKLGISTEQAEQLFKDLSEKGYLTFATENGRLRWVTEGVLDKGKGSGLPLSKSLIEEFEEYLGRPLSGPEMQRIIDMESEYGEVQVQIAMDEAAAYSHREIAYVERLLASWKAKGLTVKDLQEGYRNERK